jgi:hypothetical protein
MERGQPAFRGIEDITMKSLGVDNFGQEMVPPGHASNK